MAKHLTKEELQTDPLIKSYQNTVTFFNENKTTILAISISLIVVVGSLIGYNFYSASQEEQAQQLLATAEAYYIEGDYEKALNGDTFELTYGFIGIANDFSATEAGNLAIYYAAVSSFKMGDVGNAVEFITRYDAPEGILGVGPISFSAKMHQLNGDKEQAAELFLKAANWDENSSTTPFNLYKAAELYYELGSYEKASELTEQILSDYAGSSEVANAQKLQGRIAVAKG